MPSEGFYNKRIHRLVFFNFPFLLQDEKYVKQNNQCRYWRLAHFLIIEKVIAICVYIFTIIIALEILFASPQVLQWLRYLVWQSIITSIMKLPPFCLFLFTLFHGSSLVKSQLAKNSQEILNDIVNYGLDRTRYLVDVLEKKIYENGLNLQKSDPAHFLGVFNKQTDKSKNLSRYGYATLEASALLTRQ